MGLGGGTTIFPIPSVFPENNDYLSQFLFLQITTHPAKLSVFRQVTSSRCDDLGITIWMGFFRGRIGGSENRET